MEIKVIYLPEAAEFMFKINNAASEKLAFNVRKVRMGVLKTRTYSRNSLALKFGSSVRYMMVIVTGCCHFGTHAAVR